MRRIPCILASMAVVAAAAATPNPTDFGGHDSFVEDLRDLSTQSDAKAREKLGIHHVLLPNLEETTTKKVVCADVNIVSYWLDTSAYTGGAHGIRLIFVGTLDRRTGRRLTLDDIAPGDKRAELERKLIDALIRQRGASDYDDLVKNKLLSKPFLTGNFYYDKNKLNFVFNEYDIDCYADGHSVVPVEWPRPAGLEVPDNTCAPNP